jgi:hypothetical protein
MVNDGAHRCSATQIGIDGCESILHRAIDLPR